MKVVTSILLFLFTIGLGAEERKVPEVKWIVGPAEGSLGSRAKIQIPQGYRFLEGDDTRKVMEWMGNRPTDRELGMISPAGANWFVVFEFSDVGYVKDEEKSSLDASALLKSIQEGTEEGNKWRRERKLPELHVVGWQTKPNYNTTTHNLEWATINESNGAKALNHNVRLLGRHGVMEVTLVMDESEAAVAVPALSALLSGYDFKSGERYAEFKSGDRIAEYGLAALITGGAGAALLKSGLLAKLWKVIVVGFLAALGVLRGFWNRIFGGSRDMRPPTSNPGP